MTKDNKNLEQEFMKRSVNLAKDRALSTNSIIELLNELKVGESE